MPKKEENNMLPRPEKIIFMDGFAAQDALVEEQLCPELGKEEYRIQIAPERITLTGSGRTGLF